MGRLGWGVGGCASVGGGKGGMESIKLSGIGFKLMEFTGDVLQMYMSFVFICICNAYY